MAGRNTWKSQDARNEAVFIAEISISDETACELAKILGRKLKLEEIAVLQDRLSTIRAWGRLVSDTRQKRQDILRTLAAISKLCPSDAQTAYRTADGHTTAKIAAALWKNGVDLENPPGEEVALAAGRAYEKMRIDKNQGGRPRNGHLRELAQFARDSWHSFGCDENGGIWQREDNCSPLVAWAKLLFLKAGSSTDKKDIVSILKKSQKPNLPR